MLRWILLVVLILLLLGTAFLGLTVGFAALRDAQTPGEWAVAISQVSSGVLAVLAVAAMGARQKIATQLILGWCVAMALTAGMAPVIYGKQPIGIGVVSGLGSLMFLIIPIAIWRNRPPGMNG